MADDVETRPDEQHAVPGSGEVGLLVVLNGCFSREAGCGWSGHWRWRCLLPTAHFAVAALFQRDARTIKYRLLPDGGPWLPSRPSLCHTSGVGKLVSQSLKDCVGHCKTSANFQHFYSIIQPRQHPTSVNSAESSSQRHGYKNHRNEAINTLSLASRTQLLELKRLSRAVFCLHMPELQWNMLGNCFLLWVVRFWLIRRRSLWTVLVQILWV